MFYIELAHYLFISMILFFVGFLGLIFGRNNIIRMLMSLKLMFFPVIINFVVFAKNTNDNFGYIFAFFILILITVEAIMGMAILLLYVKNQNNLNEKSVSSLES